MRKLEKLRKEGRIQENQERDTECSDVELSGQNLELVEKFCYLGDILEGMQWLCFSKIKEWVF